MNLKDQAGKTGAYQQGVVLVKFAPSVTEAEAKSLVESLGYTLGESFLSKLNWYRVSVPEGSEHDAMSKLRANKMVLTTELNNIFRINPPGLRIK